jgi:hypothetical protein
MYVIRPHEFVLYAPNVNRDFLALSSWYHAFRISSSSVPH